jgi:hypothetical protein
MMYLSRDLEFEELVTNIGYLLELFWCKNLYLDTRFKDVTVFILIVLLLALFSTCSYYEFM